jgi:hypothetical protein
LWGVPVPLIYRRREKLNHADTILYEIDMLRFSAGRLREANWREARDAWVYLESFLTHYRNLIEFLGKPKFSKTDLHVMTIWDLTKLVPPTTLTEIHVKGMVLLNRYEPADAQGGGRISQYLQHCTTKRIDDKAWPVAQMVEEIESLLGEIEPCLRHKREILRPVRPVKFLSPHDASTTTYTVTAAAALFIDTEITPKKPPR